MNDIGSFFIWYASFIFSVVFHEYAHSIVAFKLGDDTAYKEGLLTLNPIPFIKREKTGTIYYPILSYILIGITAGWASTVYSKNWAYNHTRRYVLLSLAGPFMNLVFFLLSMLIINIGYKFNYFIAPQTINYSRIVISSNNDFIALAISAFFTINLMMFYLNILPLPTLDGAALLLLFSTKEKLYKIMEVYDNSKNTWFTYLIASLLYYLFFEKIFMFLVSIIYPGIHYSY